MDKTTEALGKEALDNVEWELDRAPNTVRLPIYFRDLEDVVAYARALEQELKECAG